MGENKENENITASPEPVRFDRWDWLALAMGVGLAALWYAVFSVNDMARYGFPGLGTGAFVLAALAAECVYLRRLIKPTRGGVFLTVCTVLLAAASGIFPDYWVRFINLAMLAFLTPASALALAGRGFPALEVRVIPETVRLFLPNLFRHFTKPFRAILRRGSGKGFWTVVLTLVMMIPVLAVILALLRSADDVFSTLLSGVLRKLLGSENVIVNIWRCARTVIFGLMLFSFLYSLARPVPEREEAGPAEPFEPQSLPFVVILAVLDLIYAVFAVIQFVYLFGGARSAAMSGGFASYARKGFFELAAVAGINLFAALLCQKASGKGQKCVKVLIWVLAGLTLVILVSAFYRMCLYISVYGLSLLRCMTLAVMLWIAVCLAAVSVKTAKPALKVFPVMLAAGLVIWLVFNYVNIDRVIESWNRSAWESGHIAEFDEGYIESLGPDAVENEDVPWPCRVLLPRKQAK